MTPCKIGGSKFFAVLSIVALEIDPVFDALSSVYWSSTSIAYYLNHIHDTRSNSDGGDDGIEIKYGSYGNIVRDNVIHDIAFVPAAGTAYPGIFAYGVLAATAAQPNIFEGNVVWNAGQDILAVSDAVIRNKIVIGTIETQSHGQVPGMRNVTIVNNTVHGDMVLRGWSTNPQSLIVANNVLYGGSISNQPSGATISANKQFSSGATGVFVDPANRNFWPTPGSPLVGAANPAFITLLGVSPVDFNGTVRLSLFDVGAYEIENFTSNPGWAIGPGFKGGSRMGIMNHCSTGMTNLGTLLGKMPLAVFTRLMFRRLASGISRTSG